MLEKGHIILGISKDGHKFRPSDWVLRLASIYGCYDAERRLQFSPYITPIRFEQQNCLFISDKLAEINPAAYQHVESFIRSNRLQVRHLDNPDSPSPPAEFPHAA